MALYTPLLSLAPALQNKPSKSVDIIRGHSTLIVIHGATDRLLTRLTAGNQPLMAVIPPARKAYTTGTGTDTALRVNNAALLRTLLRAANQEAREVAVIDSMQDTAIP